MELSRVRLLGEPAAPVIEIDDHEQVEYTQLPVTRATLSSLAVWLSVAGPDSPHSRDDMLVAGLRAAAAVARDLPEHVTVNFAMQDGSRGRWLSFDVARHRPSS